MLRDVDLSLASWLGTVLPTGTGIRFDTPRAGWEEDGSGTPFVSAFLCGIRRSGQESPPAGWSEVRDDTGRLVGRQPAAHYYRLPYLLTAWAGSRAAEGDVSQRTLEQHGLLGGLLDACATSDVIAEEHLTGALADAGLPCFVRCADTESGAAVAADWWSGFGIPVRAHLVLELVAPSLPPMVTDLAPPASTIALDTGRLPARPRTAPPAGAGAARMHARRPDPA
jgi:hypothetical protein